MVGGARRVGVVRNALDFSSDIDGLERSGSQEFDDLQAIGLEPQPLDLRE
jgi:hypothetical protein